jgi:hypothetical protein
VWLEWMEWFVFEGWYREAWWVWLVW